jgi:hypothetical protein
MKKWFMNFWRSPEDVHIVYNPKKDITPYEAAVCAEIYCNIQFVIRNRHPNHNKYIEDNLKNYPESVIRHFDVWKR